MPQGSTTFHESEERLSPRTRDMHRAIVSLMEELEAIDWYQQRMDATEDSELREILRHNRDEEKEHAAMVLEWIRRRDAGFSGVLKTYLCDSYSARKLQRESTGNAARGGSAGVSCSTTNFILEPGTDSNDAIVKGTKRGLYVTDMMGYGFNAVTGDFSRGASGFWIENGRRSYPVSEVTIAGNLVAMFGALEPANDLEFRYGTNAPTLRIEGLTVAGR